ncbi:MAG: acyltransferase [Methanolobus sp.]
MKIKSFAQIFFVKTKRMYYNFKVTRKAEKVGNNLKANGKTIVTKKTVLGDNVNFNGCYMRGTGRVEIGNNFHSGPDILMVTRFHNFDNGTAIPYDETYIEKEIIIGDNVWLGARVVILGGVKIDEGAIIQAGSVVVSDIPKYAVAGGHPAKVFKYRDIEHYEKLKTDNKFH